MVIVFAKGISASCITSVLSIGRCMRVKPFMILFDQQMDSPGERGLKLSFQAMKRIGDVSLFSSKINRWGKIISWNRNIGFHFIGQFVALIPSGPIKTFPFECLFMETWGKVNYSKKNKKTKNRQMKKRFNPFVIHFYIKHDKNFLFLCFIMVIIFVDLLHCLTQRW